MEGSFTRQSVLSYCLFIGRNQEDENGAFRAPQRASALREAAMLVVGLLASLLPGWSHAVKFAILVSTESI